MNSTDTEELPDLGFVYPVNVHAWGGQARHHDYMMSDGVVRTLSEDEVGALRTRRDAARAAISQDKRHDD